MSVRAYGFGRNGMPVAADYTYRGTGSDTLTGYLSHSQLLGAERAQGFAPYDCYGITAADRASAEHDAEREREAVDAQVSAARLRASHPAYEPPPVPSVLNGLLVSPAEQLGHDLKRARRCGRCRYMTGTPGHRLMCGDS